MATYDVSGLQIDNERIILDGGTLEAIDSGRQGWTVRVEGAHMLAARPRARVHLRVATSAGMFEGDALVASAGHRDHNSDLYYGTEFQGDGELKPA